MRVESVKRTLLMISLGSVVALSGCASMATGGGKNPVGGSAGGAHSTNANATLEHCDHSLGTLAVEEDTSEPWYAILTNQYHLPATTPLIRLMIQQSNCFIVVDRGRAMGSMMQERDLAASGEMRSNSHLGKGQMVAADYVVTPNIQFSQNTGGGGAALLGGLGGYGALIGAVAGSMKSSEASTTLMLTDTRSGVQVAISQGSAKNTDFGFGGILGGHGAAGAAGAYSKTPQGKVIAAAFLDSYNQMVKSVREYAPQRVAGGLGTGGALAVDGASTPSSATFSVADAQRKLAELGLYTSKVDGVSGPGTLAAIRKFQKIRGLAATGQLDGETVGALQQ
jgi:curli biogenesis system outer membrane secretion channel CsgG